MGVRRAHTFSLFLTPTLTFGKDERRDANDDDEAENGPFKNDPVRSFSSLCRSS